MATSRALTAQMLKNKGVCVDQYRIFLRQFGETVIVTEELAEKTKHAFNWTWVAENFLSDAGLEAYQKACFIARRERGQNWDDYMAECAKQFARIYISEG